MSMAVSFLGLKNYEWWIVVIGMLVCVSSALMGCFLVLRKMALMGDAISHAVLPGIAAATWLTGSVSSWATLVGATIVGVITPVLIDVLKSTRRIHEDASLGVVFTILFALGVVLIANMGNVHLDVDCVLFGEIATTPFDRWIWRGVDLGPRSFWILGTVLLLDVGFLLLFYKELKITTFDPALAASMGLRPQVIHYALLGMVALTTIAAFESVGAILVVAMFIAPAAAAYLLTDRLGMMLGLSAVIGMLCAVLGYAMALGLGGKVSISGSMATMAGILFVGVFFFSPRYGLASQLWRRVRLSRRLQGDHLLAALYRQDESGQPWTHQQELCERLHTSRYRLRWLGKSLMNQGLLLWEDQRLRLTPTGVKQGAEVVRAHRLWESYLEKKIGLPLDHLHRSADDMEHFISPDLQDELSHTLQHPTVDPHGQPIPSKERVRWKKKE